MEKTLFEKIADGEIPCYKVWEDDEFLAFLDIRPKVKGHTLLIPKQCWSDSLFDLDGDQMNRLWNAAKVVAGLLKRKLEKQRVLVWVEGFEVPHVHLHLLPANPGHGLISREALDMSDDEMKALAIDLSEDQTNS